MRPVWRYALVMRKILFFLCAAAAFWLAGCATSNAHRSSAQSHATIASTNSPAPLPYTRISNPDSNIVQLQIALRKFVPAHHRGPTLWLAGTSHVGEPAYYQALQKLLDAQTIVLFEGINADAHERHVPNRGSVAEPATNTMSPPPASGTNDSGSMQSTLANSLGLVFQLDAIDYDRTNFLNSDLSVLQIQRLMLNDPDAVPAAPGEPGRSNPTFDALLQVMDGSSFLGVIFKAGLQMIGSSQRLQAITRLMFIESLGNLKGDFSHLRGMPPDMQHLLQVLIEARNQNVIDDLKTEFKVVPRSGSIAVFYGTGHMEDMEQRVTHDLGYRPDGEIWLTAFSVDLRDTGLSPAELQMMRNFVKWQLDQMQP